MELKVYDLMGKVIITEKMTATTFDINTTGLLTGMYIIVGADETGKVIFQEKVVVE